MTWFWQHQNDRHPFHPLFWFVQSNLENLFAEKVWYRPKLTFILSYADDMLMICWWYAELVGHVTCLRAQATQVCVEGSEAALPKTPPRRRDCGSGQWFKRKWKVFHKLLHSFKSTLLGLKSILTEADEADLSRLARSVAMFCHIFVAWAIATLRRGREKMNHHCRLSSAAKLRGIQRIQHFRTLHHTYCEYVANWICCEYVANMLDHLLVLCRLDFDDLDLKVQGTCNIL